MDSSAVVIIEDYLEKEGKYAKSWKKRWFVLYSDRIEYFQDETKQEKKGVIYFVTQSMVSDINVVTTSQYLKKITKYSFSILGAEEDGVIQEMEISFGDESKIRSWQRTLTDTVEAYIRNLPPQEEIQSSTPNQNSSKLSQNARIQRFVVSKMAGSSVGQEVLTKAIGQDFQDVIECLCGAISKYANESISSEIKEHILKLATKIAVLSNDGVISSQDMKAISQSLRQLFLLIIKSMYRPPTSTHGDNPTVSSIQLEENLSEIASSIQNFHDTTLPIIVSHMSAANSSRLSSLCHFFQANDNDFMRHLLAEEDYNEERILLRSYAKYLPHDKMKLK